MAGKSHLVFVPGIMGTGLLLPGSTQQVWSENLLVVGRSLLWEPWLLDGHRLLDVGTVFSGALGYKDLFKFLASNGYRSGVNFTEFGYDWRQATNSSAEQLVSVLTDLAAKEPGIRFTLLGHSMGCLIARAAVLSKKSPANSIEKIIELAPPHRGASKAFRQLHQLPDLHPIITRLRQSLQFFYPALLQRFDDAYSLLARSIPGLWDLLPPDQETILSDSGRTVRRSALDWPGWGMASEVSGEVPRKRYTVYNEIFTHGWRYAKVALSVGIEIDTDYRYQYSSSKPYALDFSRFPPKLGDETVIRESAEWLRQLDPTAPYLANVIDHHGITAHPNVHQWLLGQIP